MTSLILLQVQLGALLYRQITEIFMQKQLSKNDNEKLNLGRNKRIKHEMKEVMEL